jgi:hypothetical protein
MLDSMACRRYAVEGMGFVEIVAGRLFTKVEVGRFSLSANGCVGTGFAVRIIMSSNS